MAKNLKEGDEITLRFEVRRVWEDGKVSLSNPLYPSRITINANEIPEEDIERKPPSKPVKPAQIVHYAVMVGNEAIHSTYDRDEAYAMADSIENGRVEETPMTRKRR